MRYLSGSLVSLPRCDEASASSLSQGGGNAGPVPDIHLRRFPQRPRLDPLRPGDAHEMDAAGDLLEGGDARDPRRTAHGRRGGCQSPDGHRSHGAGELGADRCPDRDVHRGRDHPLHRGWPWVPLQTAAVPGRDAHPRCRGGGELPRLPLSLRPRRGGTFQRRRGI